MKFNSKLMTAAAKMNHAKLLAALGELNSILVKKNIHIQISIYGGAGIMLLFPDFGRATKDIDATYDNFGEDKIASAIEEVAYQQDLPFDWLNNECQPYTWSPNGMKEGPSLSNIKIMLPPPAYLLASKLLAGRPVERANDAYDIQFLMGKLGISSDQAFEIFDKYFPGRKPNSFAVEEMYNRKQASGKLGLNEEGLAFIRSQRSEIRMEETGKDEPSSGQCGIVSEVIMVTFGLEMAGGFYIPNGVMGEECSHHDHVWNVMADGRIFDATHDQFGSPDILVTSANSPYYHAYCGSYDCPYCTCRRCNEGFAEEAEEAKRERNG